MQWSKIVYKENFVINPNMVICSNHFTDDYFDRTSAYVIRLQQNAIPKIITRMKHVHTYNAVISEHISEHENSGMS